MSADLRAALTELAESAAPRLEALPPARRAELVRARARGMRRRRIAARSLGALAVAAVAVGVLHVAPEAAIQPAKPPFPGTERFARTVEGRDLLASTAVEVDGDPVRLVVTAPEADLQVRFFCSRSAAVHLRVSVEDVGSAVVAGCEDGTQSTSRDGEDWTHLGLRTGRPTTLTITAVSTGGVSRAELENPPWAFVGVYGTPASALPAVPRPVPGTAGLRVVSTVTLDADHLEVLVPNLPRLRGVLYSATCAGPADGISYMIHIGMAGTQMIGQGSCTPAAAAPVPVDVAAVTDQGPDVLVRVFLASNYGQGPQDRRLDPAARVVVSFYVRGTT